MNNEKFGDWTLVQHEAMIVRFGWTEVQAPSTTLFASHHTIAPPSDSWGQLTNHKYKAYCVAR